MNYTFKELLLLRELFFVVETFGQNVLKLILKKEKDIDTTHYHMLSYGCTLVAKTIKKQNNL